MISYLKILNWHLWDTFSSPILYKQCYPFWCLKIFDEVYTNEIQTRLLKYVKWYKIISSIRKLVFHKVFHLLVYFTKVFYLLEYFTKD